MSYAKDLRLLLLRHKETLFTSVVKKLTTGISAVAFVMNMMQKIQKSHKSLGLGFIFLCLTPSTYVQSIHKCETAVRWASDASVCVRGGKRMNNIESVCRESFGPVSHGNHLESSYILFEIH